MIKLFLLITFSQVISLSVALDDQTDSVSQDWSLDQVIPPNYNKIIPPKINGQPAVVNITLVLRQLVSANEAEQAITLDLLYWQTWRDARLSVPQGIGSLTLDSSWKNKIWIPNLYFANSAQAKPVDIKSGSLFLEMNEDAIFLMSTRVIVKLACQMDLFSFPQDTQTCTIDLACVDWNNQSVNFVWQSFVLQDMDDFPKYEITDYRITDCISMRGPDFACLSVQLRLFRRFSYYAIRIYGPSILLVLTSFVGFWIPVVGYPARIALIVTPLLSLITQQTQINAEINVSYVVALHIWMMVSIFFVFMALIEYAYTIIYVHSVDEKKEIFAVEPSYGLVYAVKSNRVSHLIKIVLRKIYGDIDWSKAPLDRNKVDYIARLMFPLFYVIFIIFYSCIFIFPWMSSKYL